MMSVRVPALRNAACVVVFCVVSSFVLAAALECHGPVMRPGQASENAKQGRFARAIWTAKFKHFPTGKLERQPFEQDPQPARCREIFDLKDQ